MRDQAAVVGVQPHHVGHGAQCHQRQQAAQSGLLLPVERAARAQFGAQGQQHVKHHTHARHVFAGKQAARLVGVDQRIGLRQGAAGQVVVGHDDLHAQSLGAGHAFQAGNAVINRQQQLRACGMHPFGNGGCQAVAVGDAVGHQIAGVARAQQAQAPQRYGTGGGAVAVVIGHHADVFVGRDGVGQQARSLFATSQRCRGQQLRQAVIQLGRIVHAARRVQARQQGVNACLLQCPAAAGRNVARENAHGVGKNKNGRKSSQSCRAAIVRWRCGRGDIVTESTLPANGLLPCHNALAFKSHHP